MAGVKRGAHTGPNPTDRAKPGCKRHVICDANGIPLLVCTGRPTSAMTRWSKPMLEQLPLLPDGKGKRRKKPRALQRRDAALECVLPEPDPRRHAKGKSVGVAAGRHERPEGQDKGIYSNPDY